MKNIFTLLKFVWLFSVLFLLVFLVADESEWPDAIRENHFLMPMKSLATAGPIGAFIVYSELFMSFMYLLFAIYFTPELLERQESMTRRESIDRENLMVKMIYCWIFGVFYLYQVSLIESLTRPAVFGCFCIIMILNFIITFFFCFTER